MSTIKIRRAYTEKESDDGYRILVDKLWPRGIKKEDLSYSWWAKDIAPSTKTRKDFGHEPKKFDDFKKTYKEELENNKATSEFLHKVSTQIKKHNVTLVYGAKDEKHNQAIVLKEWADKKLNL